MTGVHTTSFADLTMESAGVGQNDKVYACTNTIDYDLRQLVDANLYALAPPIGLFNNFKDLEMRLGESVAWEESHFEERYLDYIRGNDEATTVARRVKARAQVRDVWLVCYEPEDTYCHRRLLRDYIEEELQFEFETS